MEKTNMKAIKVQNPKGRIVPCDWQVGKRLSIAIGQAAGAQSSEYASLIHLDFSSQFQASAIQLTIK
jgi:hypothetical protein